MDNTYILSMRECLNEIQSELHGLTEIINQLDFKRYEYRAVERILQILIEACIGIAKYWNYALYKTAPADAYSAFEKLSQQGIDGINDVEWRKIISMRNALVHDYLNIEPQIMRTLIKNTVYAGLLDLSAKGLIALQDV